MADLEGRLSAMDPVGLLDAIQQHLVLLAACCPEMLGSVLPAPDTPPVTQSLGKHQF